MIGSLIKLLAEVVIILTYAEEFTRYVCLNVKEHFLAFRARLVHEEESLDEESSGQMPGYVSRQRTRAPSAKLQTLESCKSSRSSIRTSLGNALTEEEMRLLSLEVANISASDLFSPQLLFIAVLLFMVSAMCIMTGYGQLLRMTVPTLELTNIGELDGHDYTSLQGYMDEINSNVSSVRDTSSWIHICYAIAFFWIALNATWSWMEYAMFPKRALDHATKRRQVPVKAQQILDMAQQLKFGGKYYRTEALMKEVIEATTQGISFLEMCGIPVLSKADPASPLVVISPAGMISYSALLMWNFLGTVLITACTPEEWLEHALLCSGMINDSMYFVWPLLYYGGKINNPETWALMQFDSEIAFIAQIIPMVSFVTNCSQILQLTIAKKASSIVRAQPKTFKIEPVIQAWIRQAKTPSNGVQPTRSIKVVPGPTGTSTEMRLEEFDEVIQMQEGKICAPSALSIKEKSGQADLCQSEEPELESECSGIEPHKVMCAVHGEDLEKCCQQCQQPKSVIQKLLGMLGYITFSTGGLLVLIMTVIHVRHWESACQFRLGKTWDACLEKYRVYPFTTGVACDCRALESWSADNETMNEILDGVAEHFTLLEHMWVHVPERAVPTGIFNNVYMQTMRLNRPRLLITQYPNPHTLPDDISRLQSLQVLSLFGQSYDDLPRGLAQSTSLLSLLLSKNFLMHVPQPIHDLGALKTLIMAQNPIQELPEWLLDLPQLKTVVISHVHPQFVALPEWVSNWPLEKFAMSVSPSIQKLPQALGSGPFGATIKELSLSFLGIQELPDDFAEMRASLEMLRLDGNPLCMNGYIGTAPRDIRNMLVEMRSCGCSETCSVWHLDDTICHEHCNNPECGYDHLPGMDLEPACSLEGKRHAETVCEFGCSKVFQTAFAPTDVDGDYQVSLAEYSASLGGGEVAAQAWGMIAAKYPTLQVSKVIPFNEFQSFMHNAYAMQHISCAACDFGCQRGDPECFEFDYSHRDKWCSNTGICA